MSFRHSAQSKKKTSILYFWSFVTLGLTAGLLGLSLPSFAANTGSTLRQLSNLFLLSSLGYMVGSFGVGLYLSKVKGHFVLAFSLIFMAIFIALLPIIKILWLLVAIFFLLGVAQSHLDVAENTLLIWLHGRCNAARWCKGRKRSDCNAGSFAMRVAASTTCTLLCSAGR